MSDRTLIGGRPAIAPNTQPPAHSRKSSSIGIVAFVAVLIVAAGALIFAMQNWTSLAKARKLKNPVPPTAKSIAAGMEVYRNHCRSCHGPNGDGKGDRASELSVAPGDFTDASKINTLTDGELYWQITKGRRPMPAFADKLSDEQRWQSVDYIRTFAQKIESPRP